MAKDRSVRSSYRIMFVFKKFVTDKVRVQMVRVRMFVRKKVRIAKGSYARVRM